MFFVGSLSPFWHMTPRLCSLTVRRSARVGDDRSSTDELIKCLNTSKRAGASIPFPRSKTLYLLSYISLASLGVGVYGCFESARRYARKKHEKEWTVIDGNVVSCLLEYHRPKFEIRVSTTSDGQQEKLTIIPHFYVEAPGLFLSLDYEYSVASEIKRAVKKIRLTRQVFSKRQSAKPFGVEPIDEDHLHLLKGAPASCQALWKKYGKQRRQIRVRCDLNAPDKSEPILTIPFPPAAAQQQQETRVEDSVILLFEDSARINEEKRHESTTQPVPSTCLKDGSKPLVRGGILLLSRSCLSTTKPEEQASGTTKQHTTTLDKAEPKSNKDFDWVEEIDFVSPAEFHPGTVGVLGSALIAFAAIRLFIFRRLVAVVVK